MRKQKEYTAILRAIRDLYETGSCETDTNVAGMPVSLRLVGQGLAVLGPPDPELGIKPLIITDEGREMAIEEIRRLAEVAKRKETKE
jgi:hypothetical protein